jgi:hypothetical protein
MKRSALVSFLTIGSLVTVMGGTAGAATFVVENTNDDGAGSLRAAIEAANTTNGDDTVDFSSLFQNPQTIQLNTGLAVNPANPNDVVIVNGTGADLITIRAPAGGGLLLNLNNGNNTINGVTFQGTTTPEFTGAVNTDSDLTLNGVVITGNTADAGGQGSAGGLVNFGANVTILNSTISNNTVNNAGPDGNGGGIVNTGTLTLTNSTISGNTVRGAGPAAGGGIFNTGNTVTLFNVTVANNTAEHGAGGIFLEAGPVRLGNSLVAGNAGDAGNDISGTDYVSDGFNLIGTGTGATFPATTGDHVGTNASVINALLGPLGANGGTTPTMPLVDGSPAINAADPTNGALPPGPRAVPSATTDQRGVARPQGGGNDIGAFELVPNDVQFGKVKRNTKNGTAKIEVEVLAAGELALKGNGIKSVRPAAGRTPHAKPVPAAGTYKLKVTAKGSKKKKLKKKGKVKIKAKITFSPTNGTPNTETKKVKLKLKR